MSTAFTTFPTEDNVFFTQNTTALDNMTKGRIVIIEKNDSITSTTSNIVITVIVAVFLLFGSIGNILTLIVIYKNKFLQVPSNYFIISLCISDLISALICSPLWLYRRTWGFVKWEWGLGACQFYWIADFTTNFATATHILTFSIARFVAIKRPFAASSLSRRRVKILIVFLWLSSFFLSLPLLWWMGIDNFRFLNPIGQDWPSCSILVETNMTCCVKQYNTYMMVAGPSLFFIPELLVILLSLSMARALLGRRKWMHGFANVYNLTEQVQRVNDSSSRRQSTVSSDQTASTSLKIIKSNNYDALRKSSVGKLFSNASKKKEKLEKSNKTQSKSAEEKRFSVNDDSVKVLQEENQNSSANKLNSSADATELGDSSHSNQAFDYDSKNKSGCGLEAESKSKDEAVTVELQQKLSKKEEIDQDQEISATCPQAMEQETGEVIQDKIKINNTYEKKVNHIKNNNGATNQNDGLLVQGSSKIDLEEKKSTTNTNQDSDENNKMEECETSLSGATEVKSDAAEDTKKTNNESQSSFITIRIEEETGDAFELNEIPPSGEAQENEITQIRSQSTIKLQPSRRYLSHSLINQQRTPHDIGHAKAYHKNEKNDQSFVQSENTLSNPTIMEEIEEPNPQDPKVPTSTLQPPPNPVLYQRKGSTMSFATEHRNRSLYRQRPRRTTTASERSDTNPNRRASSASIALERQAQQERTTFIQLTLVNISFVIGYIPITVYLMWTSNITTSSRDSFADYWFGVIAYLCLRLSECMNPVIYNLASSNIGGATRKLLRETFSCRRGD